MSQNITTSLLTSTTKPQGVAKKAPERLSKKQFKDKWRKKFTELGIEYRKRNRIDVNAPGI
jgi:hypothetical protein